MRQLNTRIIAGRIPNLYRKTLYLAFGVSWVTGVAFYVFSRFLEVEGDFGPEKHPWQFPILQVHGLASFIMLMAFGAIVANHIPITWRTKKLRLSGLILISLVVLQMLSAYLLYYASNLDFRDMLSEFHAFNGFALPMALGYHVYSTIRLERSQEKPDVLTAGALPIRRVLS